jgi:DNA-binding NarL/FixJ family response regulator
MEYKPMGAIDMNVKQDTATKILIVDDNELIGLMLSLELEQYPDLQVIGMVGDGLSAIHRAKELEPDTIIMDLRMPLMDGLTAAQHIKRELPGVHIIIYTSVSDPQVEVMAKAVPIDEFCYKDTSAEVLAQLIREHSKNN